MANATRIKILRLWRGYSQWETAARAKMSESRLSRLETGRKKPSKIEAQELAKVLGVDEGEITSAQPIKFDI